MIEKYKPNLNYVSSLSKIKSSLRNNVICISLLSENIRVEGFEPPNNGFKARGLTTWRHPIIFVYY